jgi:PPOX class probable F420-dependent enzyme
MSSSTVDSLGASAYVRVTTFRRDGRGVPTPVWVVRDGDALAIWTATGAGKVKRVRRDGTVLVGPCDLRGRPTGPEVRGHASIADAEGTQRVRRLLGRKYGLLGWLTVWGSRLRRGNAGTIAIRITVDAS